MIKRILATAALATTIFISNVQPVHAAQYRELADCAARAKSTTCITNGGTLVRVTAQGKGKVTNGRIIRQAGKYYILDTGKGTVKVSIEVMQ